MGKYYGGYPICGFFYKCWDLSFCGRYVHSQNTGVEYVGLLWLSAHCQQVFALLKMSVCVCVCKEKNLHFGLVMLFCGNEMRVYLTLRIIK